MSLITHRNFGGCQTNPEKSMVLRLKSEKALAVCRNVISGLCSHGSNNLISSHNEDRILSGTSDSVFVTSVMTCCTFPYPIRIFLLPSIRVMARKSTDNMIILFFTVLI